MRPPIEVDLTLPPAKLKEFCETHDNWVLRLGDDLLPGDVAALYDRQLTIDEPYEGVIAEIAEDGRTPRHTLTDIATRFRQSIAVMSALATNTNTTSELLQLLLKHKSKIVRDHARRALGERRGS
jgi:hypothetical protein